MGSELPPASVRELTSHGHQVLVQTGAGAEIGLTDEQYTAAGATLAADAKTIFAKAEMIVKANLEDAKKRILADLGDAEAGVGEDGDAVTFYAHNVKGYTVEPKFGVRSLLYKPRGL